MAASVGCKKDCVHSSQTSYFAVMLSIVAWSTLSYLPKDSQHGVISLGRLSRAVTDGAAGFKGCEF